jgi:glycosyltransferase involved in cell wall biosynthesis
MQNILFVIDRNFASNSAMHVSALANELCLQGLDCAVAVPRDKHTQVECGEILFHALDFSEADRLPQLFANGRGPDVVHSWTPREIVRHFCLGLRQRFTFKQFVHLEDNEELLIEKLHANLDLSDDDYPQQLSHPVYFREFLQQCAGITVIIEKLKEFVPTGVPSLTLWPGVDTSVFYPRPADPEIKSRLGIPLNATVIVYPGNVHLANSAEVRSLYLAVALLNRNGYPTCLVRTGQDFCPFLVADGAWIKPNRCELGFIPREQMPEVLAMADLFVQPGQADRFNEYRFPSKLPEFLALGKPTVLPASNLGQALIHEQHALVLERADGMHITEAIQRLLNDPALFRRLGEGALEFARTRLSWPRQAAQLINFYRSVCYDS